MKKYFTSESVTSGHPDKVCDRISDSVLDALLAIDPNSRVACECSVTTNFLLVMGEITSKAKIDIDAIARKAIRDIGYTDDVLGFNADTVQIVQKINKQSADIALGVDNSTESDSGDIFDKTGAGDQGIMFGYACNETAELMPMPIQLAHKMCKKLEDVRKNGTLKYLRPDGKGQVTVEYDDNNNPLRIEAVVLSTQHDESISTEQLRLDVKKYVIDEVLPVEYLDENTKYFINPTGRFEIGGPNGDSGLTGRKIIVDTYGGMCAHGGGAFSGKDPTKVDRSATYMARYICKNIVASGLADRCEIQVSYAIGVARPLSVMVDTFGTGKLSDGQIADIILKEFDLRPEAIINKLQLRNPVFTPTSSYGHFGNSTFSWEKIDKVDDLRKYF
ncbi:MAG: methionine adenosyltransferase [Clostridiales bacterium]|nr:methionine adenosyltransferase [Clostridiales bacterium]